MKPEIEPTKFHLDIDRILHERTIEVGQIEDVELDRHVHRNIWKFVIFLKSCLPKYKFKYTSKKLLIQYSYGFQERSLDRARVETGRLSSVLLIERVGSTHLTKKLNKSGSRQCLDLYIIV